MTKRTKQAIALVTGGSRGLGRSMALTLAERGVDVILTYRTGQSEADEVVKAIEARGRKAVALALDVAKIETFAGFVSELRDVLARTWQREHIDHLVNNAGYGLAPTQLADTSEAQFDELSAVHLKGPFFLTQQLLPLIAHGGRILNVSSGLTRYSFPGAGVYALLKGAVEVWTRYLASELGARGITVNVIAPGGVETDFGGGVMRDEALKQYVAEQTALGRVAQPEDIGNIVGLLLSPESAWLTGQRLELTGGFRL